MSDDVYTDEIDEYGTHRWFKNGLLHREGDLPAEIWDDGTQFWYKEGKCHREGDLPAKIWASGTQQWFKEGKWHRDGDLPAIIGPNGAQSWWKEGVRHREGDLPAIIWADGSQQWCKEGKTHRELGPAWHGIYVLNGLKYCRDLWLLRVTRSQRVILAEWWEERRRWRNDLPKREGGEYLEMLGRLPRACLAEVLMQISPVRE